MAKYPDAAVAEAVRAPNFPYRSVALLDTASSTPTMPLTAIPAPLSIKAAVTHQQIGYTIIALDGPAPAGSALVVSESFYPGWTATIDGRPASTERANLALIGVPLPTGARRIELQFESPAYVKGKRISLVAIAMALLLAISGLVMARRRVSA